MMNREELLTKMGVDAATTSEAFKEKLMMELQPQKDEKNSDYLLRGFETMRALYPDHEIYGNDADYAVAKTQFKLEWNRGETPEQCAKKIIDAMSLEELTAWFTMGKHIHAMKENPAFAAGAKVSVTGATEWIR